MTFARSRFAAVLAACLLAPAAPAADVETPPDEPASASLPPDLASGPNFHVSEPVSSDGLMHHYVVDSRFGRLPAYGREALKVRVGEVAALTQLKQTGAVDVIRRAVARQVKANADTLLQTVSNPVKTVAGIPKGIGHLLSGYKAQAAEAAGQLQSEDAGTASAAGSAARTSGAMARAAKSESLRYADRYLGISASERRYYQELGVDPYTANDVLVAGVKHLAKIDAAANLGLHFAGIPGLPYLGDMRRAMDAIYTEDPAVLQARRRATLQGYGLTPAEIRRFHSMLLLSPTRQLVLEECARALVGVDGRDELFRHAMSLTSDDEVEVFLGSARLLARLHAHRPVSRVLTGLRLPAAVARDGRIVVLGAFDAVFWTEDVAAYESSLHAALPAAQSGLELWLAGAVSPMARRELEVRGWDVHEHAEVALATPPAP